MSWEEDMEFRDQAITTQEDTYKANKKAVMWGGMGCVLPMRYDNKPT